MRVAAFKLVLGHIIAIQGLGPVKVSEQFGLNELGQDLLDLGTLQAPAPRLDGPPPIELLDQSHVAVLMIGLSGVSGALFVNQTLPVSHPQIESIHRPARSPA